MERYVALVLRGPGFWTVLFPDFPGVEATGFPLHIALWKAKRMIGARAAIVESLGAKMPKPMGAADVVSEPGYENAMPFIVAVRRATESDSDDVFRLG